MGIDFDYLKKVKDLGVKEIGFDPNTNHISYIEFFPSTPTVQAVTSHPPLIDMPGDDVMLFAATEDPEEAMKERSE